VLNLTVIIPTYNRRNSLFRLLEALQKQVEIKLQIIVLDQNDSTFWSNEELTQFTGIERYSLTNPNVSAARNFGYTKATYNHLLFIDDDLVPEIDFCKKAVAVFSQNGVKAFCPTVYAYEGLENAQKAYAINHQQSVGANMYKIGETLSACLFFEKEYFYKTGGFDPILFDYAKSTEDQELFKRMEKRTMNFYHADSISIFHDDKTAGGCDLRSEDYWASRYKFMKGWVYRYMMHNNTPGTLTFGGYFKMVRSAFLNKKGLANGFGYCKKQLILLHKALKETKLFIKNIPKSTILEVCHFNYGK
jgi:glycosyltransferase involved in cell wall biosynthesis